MEISRDVYGPIAVFQSLIGSLRIRERVGDLVEIGRFQSLIGSLRMRLGEPAASHFLLFQSLIGSLRMSKK